MYLENMKIIYIELIFSHSHMLTLNMDIDMQKSLFELNADIIKICF